MSEQLILLIEDDQVIRNFMTAILKGADYQVVTASSGREGISLTASLVPALVVLDLGLPDMDGFAVLTAIRTWSDIPVMIVSARGDEAEKVRCLDGGADDYLTKPFGTSELLARIRAALRHRSSRLDERTPLVIGDLTIDFTKRKVTVAGKDVHLTPNEYKIIQLLGSQQGKVLTHDFIMKEVWGPYVSENQALRVNMSNIRRKIEQNPADPQYILTEIGIGYRLSDWR